MTTEKLVDSLKQIIDELCLNDRAIKTLNKIKVVDSSDEGDQFPEFLNGFSREEIIFKPKQQSIELYNRSGFNPIVITIIGIYIIDEQKVWADNLKPIGRFIYETDLSGEYIGDYIEITETRHTPLH